MVSIPTDYAKVIKISAAYVAKGLLLIVCVLLCMHSIGLVLESIVEYESRLTRIIVRYFDFNGEENVPAFFSSVMLLIAASLLYLIFLVNSKVDKRNGRRYWLVLSLIFVFMAIDESAQVHEHVAEFVRPQLSSDLNGLLYWSWVLPYAAGVALLGVFFLKWVFSLPSFTRNLFLASGCIFVGAAIGFELVEGYLYKHYGIDHIYNRIMYTFEELLEMGAIVLFIFALLDYLASLNPVLLISNKVSEIKQAV
ncbi:multidrug transporter [Pontibacter sp. SD6]|uniref:Multidrug transporter n=1 Tax=Pontibacter cellulosilyticus TaxID=1720253 RepID=A0A923SI74_9BACT|nr:multidrug transporter [Pontibacter cellulosilyticus]